MPPLREIEAGLRRTTEALARALASGGSIEVPRWTELEWRLAEAAATMQGVAPLLCESTSQWNHPAWRGFLATQREHVEQRHRRIDELLRRIDGRARAADLAMIALKGAALHALRIYAAGERPMADVDLLVRADDMQAATRLVLDLGYAHAFDHWRHRVFAPLAGRPREGLGEHRDAPINIELHAHLRERLPATGVDITDRVWARLPHAGLNSYASHGALMSHLLLHAAGNMCARTLRLVHLHDIARLASRMTPADWDFACAADATGAPWWALPPLLLVGRYYRDAIPADVPVRLARSCPSWLKAIARRQTLTQISGSRLWVQAFPGIEWSRSAGEAARCVWSRIHPSQEKIRERADQVRTQFWLQGQNWAMTTHRRRALAWLTRRVPRADTLYAVCAALDESHADGHAMKLSARIAV